MSNIIIPQQEDYRSQIEQVIRETRLAITIAFSSLEGQEDSLARQEIDAHLNTLETDMYCLSGALDRLHTIAMKLMEQRDEVLGQRDLLIALCGLPEYGGPLS
jgi:hypothetical protein